jgi:hypothetical protein
MNCGSDVCTSRKFGIEVASDDQVFPRLEAPEFNKMGFQPIHHFRQGEATVAALIQTREMAIRKRNHKAIHSQEHHLPSLFRSKLHNARHQGISQPSRNPILTASREQSMVCCKHRVVRLHEGLVNELAFLYENNIRIARQGVRPQERDVCSLQPASVPAQDAQAHPDVLASGAQKFCIQSRAQAR